MESESQRADNRTSNSAKVFIGSYRLMSLRSRQGECEVWTALHRPTDMEVVMEIYPKSGDDKQLVESIVRKIDLFVALAGSKVLRLLEVIDADGSIFLVYEHYSTQSLRQYVLNCPLNGKEFLRLVRSLVKIVQGLHRNCFFHGTLGIDSFVLTRQKKIKFKDAPSCHTFLRSQDEPARFDAILSKASDVWSTGTIIYRLISDQFDSGLLPPASGGSTAEAVAKIISELDADLSDLLARMTDQNPAARISTADCLRHPYLTRSQPSLVRLRGRHHRAAAAAGAGRISLDVVRFLSRATGAPMAELAAAAASNDLSSWCATYWLMRQRLADGRGYPTLTSAASDAAADAASDSRLRAAGFADDDDDDDEVRRSEPATTQPPASTATRATGRQQADSGGFRRKISLLRSRRLGLTSPRETAGTAGASLSGDARLKQQQQQQQPRQQEEWGTSLPPITVRSAGNSERTQRSNLQQQQPQQQQPQRQQNQYQKQQQSLTARYLTYILMQEPPAGAAGKAEAAAAAAAAAAAVEFPPAESRGTSAIRVRVQRRPHATQRQAVALATLATSPRQPPNSRTDLARPPEGAGVGGAASAVGDDDEDAEWVGDLRAKYLWENAIVRRPQWLRSVRAT